MIIVLILLRTGQRVTATTRRPTSSRAQRESDEECDESDRFSLDTWKTWLQISSRELEESESEIDDDCNAEDHAS